MPAGSGRNKGPSFPHMPTGFDPASGMPLLGSQGFAMFDRTLTIQDGMPLPPQMFDLGFLSTDGRPPQLAYAVAATWCYTAAALGAQQQKITDLYQALHLQQTQIADTQQLILGVAQTVQQLIDALPTQSGAPSSELRQLGRGLKELLKGIELQGAPDTAEDDPEAIEGDPGPADGSGADPDA